MANNNVGKGATLIDFNNSEPLDEHVIHMKHDSLEKLKNIINLSQRFLLNYFANVAEENIKDEMTKPLNEYTEDEQNDMLMRGMAIHSLEIMSLYSPDSPITTTMMAEYFEDFPMHLETYMIRPFQTYKELVDLNLEAYVEDVMSTEEESTLDTFWLTRARDFVDDSKALEASRSMAIDYSQMMFDCLTEVLNAAVESYWQENSNINPFTEVFKEGLNDHIKLQFGTLFSTAFNNANSDFLNYLFDPSSKILMRLVKYVEEETYDFFTMAIENEHSFAQRYERFEQSSRGSKTSAYEYFQDDFVEYFLKSRSMELFSTSDFKLLNTENLMRDAESEAFDFLSRYVGDEDLSEDSVLETHTRVAICVQIYKLFFRHACQEIEASVKRLTEDFLLEDYDTPEEYREARSAHIMVNEASIMMEAITHASNILWRDLYPKHSYMIHIDEDEAQEAPGEPQLEAVSQ